MPFFLTRPAASDTETATTARAFEGGADAEVQARDLRQKLAAEKERNDADNATKLAEKQQAQTAAQSVARLKLLHDNSEKSYEEANTELQDALKTKGIDPAARSQLIERQVALRKTHATDATGTVDYSGYGTSAQPKITPEQTNVNEAEKLKILKEGAEAKAKIEELSGGNAGGGKPGKPAKISEAAQKAADQLAITQNLITRKGERLKALREMNKIDPVTGRPQDPDIDLQYREAAKDYSATSDGYIGSYATIVNRLQDGGFGPDAQRALEHVSRLLPTGTDLTDPGNYVKLKAAVEGALQPLVAKKASGGSLSPAEETYVGRFNALANVLPNQDPALVLAKGERAQGGIPTSTDKPTGGPIGAPPTDGSIDANPAGGNSAGFSGTTGAPTRGAGTVPWDGGDR